MTLQTRDGRDQDDQDRRDQRARGHANTWSESPALVGAGVVTILAQNFAPRRSQVPRKLIQNDTAINLRSSQKLCRLT